MTDDFSTGLDTTLLAQASGLDPEQAQQQMMQGGATLQRMASTYATAIKVQQPRDLNLKTKQLTAEARIAGEAFYYGWGSGKDRVLGPSIGLAMAAARIWGNCVVEPAPLQETDNAWILLVSFVDLETGFTVGRQFRQDKEWTVYGKFDEARKTDIRFQIGQSKAARNVILSAIPKWLTDMALKEAQAGVREKVENFIKVKGVVAAQDLVIRSLAKHGIPEEAILAKMQVADRKALQVDHLVALRGDMYCLDEGQDRASELYPAMKKKQAKGTTSNLDSQLDGDQPPEPNEPSEPQAPTAQKKTTRKRAPKKKAQATTATPPAAQEPQFQEPHPADVNPGPDIDPATGEVIPDSVGMAPEQQAEQPPVEQTEPEPEAAAEQAPTEEQVQRGEEQLEAEQLADDAQANAQGSGPEVEVFLGRIRDARAVGQVEDLLQEVDQACDDQGKQLVNAAATDKINAIRASYRNI